MIMRTIAAEIAVAADHPMARHEQGELVRGAGLSDRADRFWLAERRGDLGIARGLAERDLLQCPPHPRLERGALDVGASLEQIYGTLQSRMNSKR
jgi:hypothetical protein